MTQIECFQKDLANTSNALDEMGAVRVLDDGFMFIDPAVAPASLIDAYQHLLQFGYANGYL